MPNNNAFLKYIFIFVFIISVFINCKSTSKTKSVKIQENALLWQINGGDLNKPSYLFGTIHMICPEDFILSDSIKSTFARSEKIYLEIDMDDPAMTMKTLQLAMMKDKSLKDLMSKEDYARLNKFMQDSVGMPLTIFNKMKPFTLMSILYTKVLPCPKMESYEQSFMTMAQQQKKEILGLEKLEDQFAVFDQIPDSAEVRMILEMIDNFGAQQKEFAKMTEAYKRKDLEALSTMINASPDMAGYENLLLVNRNKNWIPVMEKAMATQSTFFAVGAGHLPGQDGVISLLRKAGYTVSPVE
ncbi:MAG: TraB/GumN family protein [Chitinophagaceae bacterium]